MRADSIEWIWFPVTGTAGWTDADLAVSINAGVTWVPAEVPAGLARNVILESGAVGQTGYVRVLSTALGPLTPRTVLRFLVRATTLPETPVIAAGSLSIT